LSRLAFWRVVRSDTVRNTVKARTSSIGAGFQAIRAAGVCRDLSRSIGSDTGICNSLTARSPADDNGTDNTVNGTATSLFGFAFLLILIPSCAGARDQSSQQPVASLRLLPDLHPLDMRVDPLDDVLKRRLALVVQRQQWFGLSDPAMEEALHDVPLYREFADLEGPMRRLPEESTIVRFRHLLEARGLAAPMLDTVNLMLQERGLTLKTGTVVNATLIAAPSSTKNSSGERDPGTDLPGLFRPAARCRKAPRQRGGQR
jgi:hypothetical protein